MFSRLVCQYSSVCQTTNTKYVAHCHNHNIAPDTCMFLLQPLVSSSGMVAIQSSAVSSSQWRIAATGVILEQEANLRVVKKLKLVGAPFKVHRYVHERDVKGCWVCFDQSMCAHNFSTGLHVCCIRGLSEVDCLVSLLLFRMLDLQLRSLL